MYQFRKAVLPAILLSLLPTFVYADSIGTPGVNTGEKYRFRKKYTNNPTRPQMPGKDFYISVNIENGVLTVEFPSDAEMGTVTIGTGDFTVFAASIDSSNPSVQLPPLSGSFIFSIAFDNGDEYEGEIDL